MSNIDPNLILFPGARVLFKGEVYNLIEADIVIEQDPVTGVLFCVQTFWLNKAEAGAAREMHKLIQVLPKEITPLAGNDYYQTSAFNLGMQAYLEGL